MSAERIDVLAVFDGAISEGERFTSLHPDPVAVQHLTTMRAARAAVAELIEADREVDDVEAEMRAAYFAGPRHGSYGTGWESRDAAAKKDREQRHEAAHKRRAAALARIGGAS